MELHVEEAARSPCDCHAQSCRSSRCDCCARSRRSPSSLMKTLREMDDNEVDETSSKQRECLLALLSVASATSAAAPPPPVHTLNLLLTAWSTSTTAAEALALLCSISLSRRGDGKGAATRFGEQRRDQYLEHRGRRTDNQSSVGGRFSDAQCHQRHILLDTL
jgi:hypothetical protein